MTHLAAALVLALCAAGPLSADDAAPASLRGRVLDAQTGEPIAKARVSLPALGREVVTGGDGTFAVPDLAAGEVQLVVSTVGYGIVQETVVLGGEPGPEPMEIRVGQEALKRSEDVVVEAAPFASVDPAAPNTHTLGGVELRNLASVLTDDPLRSVQSLPGVAATDDFYASFAVRGAGFPSVGFYIDGVPTSAPFHTILDTNDAYSLTMLNGDVVESLSFIGGAAPARYGDRTGAVLNVETREGNREEFSGRASLGASGAYATVEGPLGAGGKTSWLVSARKSYLDYVLDRIDAGAVILGYYDFTTRLAHHPTPSQTVGLTVVHGRSTWEDRDPDVQLDDTASATVAAELATLRWVYLPSSRFRLDTSVFGSLDTGRNQARSGAERFYSRSTQWGLRADVLRVHGAHHFEAGGLFRGLSGQTRDVDGPASAPLVTATQASAPQWGGYLQDTWSTPGARLSLTLGGRFDRFEETQEARFLPRASASLALTSATRASVAYGSFAQFPSFLQLEGAHANPDLQAERSRHLVVALEQQLGQRTRLRLEAYVQDEDRLIFARAAEWRIEDGRVVAPLPEAPLGNSLAGQSRGFEILLQRRSANGLSGWVAYAFGHARRTETASDLRFDADFDQRHTLTAYASARVTQTLNLSAKFRYGSGFPIVGFYRRGPEGGLFLAEGRNAVRADVYSRLDLRANKTWIFRSWKLTAFAELLNVLGHPNTRHTGFDLNPRTGRVTFEEGTLFPRLPSVGLTADF
jgi:TonB-dependent receptor-like protein/carboxypeptidase family protein